MIPDPVKWSNFGAALYTNSDASLFVDDRRGPIGNRRAYLSSTDQ